eukprot:CAMPEP_0196589790 /NCGR_PEP_ID=MMETSP1081-20130531/64627_1 /TAXON_ID=36882 /ORGANISM="Pyramimonas amylifera, Strain CCMP720" /LENGTH=38 /DNA_ID= /DNA_START= /DNA_END= /DNA_ORIENTATION=
MANDLILVSQAINHFCDKYNIDLASVHISGVINVLADK